MKTIQTLMLGLMSFSLCMAQEPENHSCGTTQHMNYLMKKNPGLEQELKDVEVKMQKLAEQPGT